LFGKTANVTFPEELLPTDSEILPNLKTDFRRYSNANEEEKWLKR